MFYLIEFGKILKSNLLLSVIFIFATVSLLSVSSQRNLIKKELSISTHSSAMPYFNAIVSKAENIDSVLRRMKELPGVVNVEKHGVSSIQNQIARLKKTFGNEVINALASVSYKRVKIEVEPGLNTGSLSLIKEYLARLIGKEAVKIGNIKYPAKVKVKSNGFLNTFLRFFDLYAQLVLAGLWLISALLILSKVGAKAYIIEKFQRKSNTNLKITLSGFSVLALVILSLNFLLMGQVNIMAGLVFFAMLISLIVGSLTLKSRY